LPLARQSSLVGLARRCPARWVERVSRGAWPSFVYCQPCSDSVVHTISIWSLESRYHECIRHLIHAGLRRFSLDINRVPSDLWLRRLPIRTIIDVGANDGQFAGIARRLYPAAHIYSFEPLGDCFSEMRLSFKNDPLWRGYQCALGAEEGMTQINRSPKTASSSLLVMAPLHEEAFPESSGGRVEQVPIRRLDDVFQGATLTHDILIKLDVQGFEDRVLAGAGSVLAQARIVITEVSFERLYDDQASFDDIYGRLCKAGFHFHGSHSQVRHPLDGRVLQEDAIFIRGDAH